MRSHLRNQVAALFLLAPATVGLTVVAPAAAFAEQAPEVRSLEVNSDNGTQPGSRLRFVMKGSARAQASVRIRGVQASIPLREVSPGVYVGRYVVARADRIEEGNPVRAILRQGNRTATASYNVPGGLGNVASAPGPQELRIERFHAAAVDRIEPGTELRFMLEGAPGAQASVDLQGIATNVPLREVRPGYYEGAYTLRRADQFNPSASVVATLRAGDRTVTSRLAQPLLATDNRPPLIANLSPREGETIPGGPGTVVSGNFEDRGGSGVDPNSVRILLSGRNVTAEANVTPESFSYRGPLPPGRHTVDVTARDRAGNTVRRSWSFDVVSGRAGAPAHNQKHG